MDLNARDRLAPVRDLAGEGHDDRLEGPRSQRFIPADAVSGVLQPYSSARPYRDLLARDWRSLGAKSWQRGELLVVRAARGVEWAHVRDQLLRIMHAFEQPPIVMWDDLLPRGDAIMLFARAHVLGVRAHFSESTPDPELLRIALTDLGSFGRILPLWLKYRGLPIQHQTAGLLEDMVLWINADTDVAPYSSFCGGRWQTVRRVFERSQLGQPALWLRVLRVLCVALRIQMSPNEPIERLALRSGYYDSSALRHRFREVIGATPREIRDSLGWEWMLRAALSRNNLLTPMSVARTRGLLPGPHPNRASV